MKKLAVIVAVTLSLTACHYGKEEAGKSLERNAKYKETNVEQGPAINAEVVKGGGNTPGDTIKTDTLATTQAVPLNKN